MGWPNEVKVSLRSFSRRHIDVMIDEDTDSKTWRCTRFYGAPKECRRKYSWRSLRSLDDCLNIPWLGIRYFNEITFSFEKKGGLPRRETQMCKFRDTISECSLTDLGFQGQWFT